MLILITITIIIRILLLLLLIIIIIIVVIIIVILKVSNCHSFQAAASGVHAPLADPDTFECRCCPRP